MGAAAAGFHQRERAAVDQRGGAAEHGVGAFHGLQGDAGALANGHALADVETRQGARDAAAVLYVGEFGLGGLAAGESALGGEQGLQQRGGIGQADALVREHLGDAADESVGVLLGERGEQLDQAPVGADRREDLCVLDLARHHDFLDAFLFEDVDELAEFAE